jgi:carbon monoxide dehydrogenase subunit G
MKLSGTQIIPAGRDVVWAALNDAAVLKQCIPGCESIDQSSSTEMSAKVGIKLGPVKASFNGAVTLSDLKPPESYRISGQGQGGLAGFASGGASVKLTALGPMETQLDYDVDAQVGGKIAMLGSRLIDSTAKSLAQQFFTKFAHVVGQRKPASTAKAPKAKAAAAKKPAKKKVAAKKAAVKKAAPKKAAAKKAGAKKTKAKRT